MRELIVAWVTVGPFQENSYVVGDPDTKEAILIDPGDEFPRIEALLEREGLRPIYVLNTHAHLDHVGAVGHFQERHGLPFYIHQGERQWLDGLQMQAQMFGLPPPIAPRVDKWIEDGETLSVGGRTLRVIHTPGHTPGGCSFFFENERVLITGDTLFAGSVGRTDFPGGSWPDLRGAIRDKLFPLGDDVRFYSGHGPPSTLGAERQGNPFVGDSATLRP